MSFDLLKGHLPDRAVPTRIYCGPFRGACMVMNPRHSLRKIFGLYEYELNAWLEAGIRQVTRALDVGANDGYFTFGCAAAFRRLGVKGEIVGFEPEARNVEMLRKGVAVQKPAGVRCQILHTSVGREVTEGVTTLDALPQNDRRNTLIKIDVEGAELDVIAGSQSWMDPSNLFVIEVHKEEYLERLQHMFAEHGMKLDRVDQRPLALLGREQRSEGNWWLVSNLCGRDKSRGLSV